VEIIICIDYKHVIVAKSRYSNDLYQDTNNYFEQQNNSFLKLLPFLILPETKMGTGVSSEEKEKVGYRVLGVQPSSPASSAGFVSYFDFILSANGVTLRATDSTFVEIIKASENKPLSLTVYNSKSHSLRDVVVVPNRAWLGDGYLGSFKILIILLTIFRHCNSIRFLP
jgi:hypothetical protein